MEKGPMTNGVPNRKAVQQAIESRRFPGLSDVQYREQIATYLSAWSGQTVRPGEASYDAGVDDFIQKFDQNPQNLHLAAPTHDNLAMFLDYVRMALFEKTAAQSSNPALFQPEIMATRARYALDAPGRPRPYRRLSWRWLLRLRHSHSSAIRSRPMRSKIRRRIWSRVNI